jgi:hypothetical protein
VGAHALQPYAPQRYVALRGQSRETRQLHAAARAGSRAYQLVVAGGVAGTVGVVGLVLAAVGVVGAGWPIIALVIAAICVVLFRRQVGR